jgi:SAM-dependent methyltransferase
MSLRARARAWATTSPTIEGWRRARYDRFVALCGLEPDDRILDVGAGLGAALERFNNVNPITAIDLTPNASPWMEQANVTAMIADATRMPFADGEFAVAFSNSVIEHVPLELQHAFASEVRRVSRRYFIQTPNRTFPIEPHYQFPLFQFLPERARRFLNRHFTLGFQPKGHWEPIELLGARDMQRLFPDATIHREKVLGMTKSLMAVRR